MPDLLSNRRIRHVLRLARAGNRLEVCAKAVELRPAELESLIRTDDAFAGEWERAVALAEAYMVAIVAGKATGDWRAASFWLERQRPEEWARVNQRERPAKANAVVRDGFAEVDELATRRREAG